MPAKIPIDREIIAGFCKRHKIAKLSLFGSVLRDDYDPQRSDVDVLIEFEPDYCVGLITLAGIEIELSDLLDRKVDLRTPQELSRYFRDDVLRRAEIQYAS